MNRRPFPFALSFPEFLNGVRDVACSQRSPNGSRRRRNSRLSFLLLLTLPTLLQAKLITQPVDYKDPSGTALHGFAVYDDTWKEKRPGVLIIHDWRGVSGETRRRAEMIAGLGYVAFIADIYGKDLSAASPAEWAPEATVYKDDRDLFRARARAAYDAMKALPQVDPSKLAAIGYCFGGTGVVEMARDGLDLRGIVSFHGGLDYRPVTPGAAIKPRILLLCGADDPHQKLADLTALEMQLKESQVKYEVVSYEGALHAFTDPTVDALNQSGAKYNAPADKASWKAMETFLKDVFQ